MRRGIELRAVASNPQQPTFTGVAPVTIGERLGWIAEQPMRAERPQ